MDRPKDKPSALAPPRPALPVHAIDGTQVASYLRQHPDFLAEHLELLDVLTPPNPRHGERVVDLQYFMLERQRAEIARLKTQQRTLVATTRANLVTQSRIHAAVLAILAAQGFEQLIQIVTTDLAVLLDADVVTIGVEQSGPTRPRLHHNGVRILDAGTVDALLGAEREVALFGEMQGDARLFGSGAGLVRSAAIARLSVSAATPPGLLSIGTRRAGEFHAGQGTELLGFLARALGSTIAAWLDLPA